MYKSEIVVYQCEARILRCIGDCIRIKVESHKPARRGQPPENFPAMAAASESGVGISSVRVLHQGVYANIQQYGIVVFRHCRLSFFLEAFCNCNELIV